MTRKDFLNLARICGTIDASSRSQSNISRTALLMAPLLSLLYPAFRSDLFCDEANTFMGRERMLRNAPDKN